MRVFVLAAVALLISGCVSGFGGPAEIHLLEGERSYDPCPGSDSEGWCLTITLELTNRGDVPLPVTADRWDMNFEWTARYQPEPGTPVAIDGPSEAMVNETVTLVLSFEDPAARPESMTFYYQTDDGEMDGRLLTIQEGFIFF